MSLACGGENKLPKRKPVKDAGNPLLNELVDVLGKREPAWVLESAMYPDETKLHSQWRHGDESLVIQIALRPSAEDAATHFRMFDWHLPLTEELIRAMALEYDKAQLPQPIKPDTKLPNLGDENSVWTKYNQEGNSLIKVRRGRVIVQVDAASFVVAKRFAEHVMAMMPAI